ncbi:MAG: tRNA preQ1(34) S-adenosylmethionine ribosyltransferase-isomerase QueA [Lautropia sp.]
MRLADFDYDLPSELIAQHPPPRRTDSRLLVVDGVSLRDCRITDLAHRLAPGDLLVVNDTKVIRARLAGRRESGGRVEAMIERILDSHRALALVRASHRPPPGSGLLLGPHRATVVRWHDQARATMPLAELRFDDDIEQVLAAVGELPLPPYIRHRPDAHDESRYQTTYATHPGAVAAPTAGLHFDEALLATLQARGIRLAHVTLHVGAGTFLPVRVESIDEHRMHAERYEIGEGAAAAIRDARAEGRRIVAVGTTTLRALEASGGRAGAGETDLFIRPGYRFGVVDLLLTNFHLPRSTLLLLVSAFAGIEPIRAAYRHAIARRYRFFSYGDAMLLTCAAPVSPTSHAPEC